MKKIVEGKLHISFVDEAWEIIKYDDCDAFIKVVQKSDHFKGVDIIGIHNEKEVILFEIKDYNGYEAEAVDQFNCNLNEMVQPLCQKIKDTIVGSMAIVRDPSVNDAFWNRLITGIGNANGLKFVFWIDGDLCSVNNGFKRSLILHSLKRRLGCMGAKIIVTDHKRARFVDLNHNYIYRGV
ncbi:MAG: hypothetical protein C0593_08785 [Marinilabiliales bacterium]|nr:MAG: hypothetical protein C0593_08785 [Marinilabiliales bacterium]